MMKKLLVINSLDDLLHIVKDTLTFKDYIYVEMYYYDWQEDHKLTIDNKNKVVLYQTKE